jgi:hypothetical protein
MTFRHLLSVNPFSTSFMRLAAESCRLTFPSTLAHPYELSPPAGSASLPRYAISRSRSDWKFWSQSLARARFSSFSRFSRASYAAFLSSQTSSWRAWCSSLSPPGWSCSDRPVTMG